MKKGPSASVYCGKRIKAEFSGGSHDEFIALKLWGIPAGVPVDVTEMKNTLRRRAPGQTAYATARKEADEPVFLGGLDQSGRTTGGVIEVRIYNRDVKSGDYALNARFPRPSHADYPAVMKYGKDVDLRGGGIFSGRLTALTCVAGSVCRDVLKRYGAEVFAHISSVRGISDRPFDPVTVGEAEKNALRSASFPVLDPRAGERMTEAILAAKESGDSVGGVIECAVTGLFPGVGEHVFAGMEEHISALVFSVPGVKGIEFGAGFSGSGMTGSGYNDGFRFENGIVKTVTNHCGGILGGMSDGMPVVFRAAFKPVPSIALPQAGVDLETRTDTVITVKGRHDPCIVPRAVPVIECAAAIAVTDLILYGEEKTGLEALREEIGAADEEIVRLFCRRIDIARKIGDYKAANGLAVFDAAREEAVMRKNTSLADEDKKDLVASLYETIFTLSKKVQRKGES